MWKKLDLVLVAALSVVVSATCIAVGYIFLLANPSAKSVQPLPSPAPIVADLSPAPAQPSSAVDPDLATSTPDTTGSAVDEEPMPKAPAPQGLPVIDHSYDGVITPAEISRIKASLRLSPDQEPKWHALETAFREAGVHQKERIDSGQELDPPFNEELLATLIPSAVPLVQVLRGDQLKGAGKLARALGMRNVSALAAAADLPADSLADQPKPKAPAAVTPPAPPIAKAPALITHRYDGLLTAAEIDRIKLALKLRPEQQAYWPPVAAILRELGQLQMAQVDAGQQLDATMSGGLAQRFYSAASPLLQTLTEEQKTEVRRRARMMGLEAYASYL